MIELVNAFPSKSIIKLSDRINVTITIRKTKIVIYARNLVQNFSNRLLFIAIRLDIMGNTVVAIAMIKIPAIHVNLEARPYQPTSFISLNFERITTSILIKVLANIVDNANIGTIS